MGSPKRILPILVAFLLVSARLDAAQGNRPWSVGPAESWVTEAEVPPAPASDESTGIRYRLLDQQLHVGADSIDEYFRTVWQAVTTAGIQDADEVQIAFDPTFQRLTLHHVRVIRKGKAVWSVSPAEVRVIEAEQDLEQRLYNGDLTAIIFPKDLRVGDVVDYAYTLHGQNPVLGGRFDDILAVGFSFPVDRVRRRLLWPRERKLSVRTVAGAPKARVDEDASLATYTWEAQNVQPTLYEDRVPSSFPLHARVEVSEFPGWSDVALRCRSLFAPVDEQSPALDGLVRSWKLAGLAESDRLDRAVRFVQDEVRYLGIEIGPNSHAPHRPSETLARRFGDCKDKSSLLVALLRRLGIEAWPALVSTRTREALDVRLPSLFAFDHAIVAVRIGGKLLFVDATASQRGGRVVDRQPPRFARALVLEAGCSGLTTIPPPTADTPTTEIDEVFEVANGSKEARLAVTTTYRGSDADEARQQQTRSTRAELAKRYRDFYSHEHGAIEVVGEPTMKDDREHNVVVIREAYSIPSLFDEGLHDFHAWAIHDQLKRPETLERTLPLSIAHPEHVKQTLTIRLPEAPSVEHVEEIVTSNAFALSASCTVRGREARLDYTYRSLSGSVPPAEVPRHIKNLEHAADLVTCRVETGGRRSRRVATRGGDGTEARVALGIVGFGLVALLAWGTRAGVSEWQAHRRRTAFRSRVVVARGEAPHTALCVTSADAIEREGGGGTCGCGGPWRETDRSSVLYEGRPMTVVSRRCFRCSVERTLYFRIG